MEMRGPDDLGRIYEAMQRAPKDLKPGELVMTTGWMPALQDVGFALLRVLSIMGLTATCEVLGDSSRLFEEKGGAVLESDSAFSGPRLEKVGSGQSGLPQLSVALYALRRVHVQ